jgi:hypothetical protein
MSIKFSRDSLRKREKGFSYYLNKKHNWRRRNWKKKLSKELKMSEHKKKRGLLKKQRNKQQLIQKLKRLLHLRVKVKTISSL